MAIGVCLVLGFDVLDLKGALRLGLWLRIDFPVILLTGSMLWQTALAAGGYPFR